MFRKVFTFTLFYFIIILSSYSQYDNDWIEYSQQYFTIKIWEDGVYKVTYSDLVSAGFPLANIDARNIQMFARGAEIPIYIQGENDGIFNEADYILFCGEKNTGWLDTVFYENNYNQPNADYSFYNDTIYYYITANGNVPNKRFTLNNATATKTISYCEKTVKESYTNGFYYGTQLPTYTSGEGWASSIIAKGRSKFIQLPTPNFKVGSGMGAQAKYGVMGISRTTHVFDVGLNETRVEYKLSGLFTRHLTLTSNESLEATTPIFVENTNSVTDNIAISYLQITYPHTLDFTDYSFFTFRLPKTDEVSTAICNTGNVNGYVFDISNAYIYALSESQSAISLKSNTSISSSFIFTQSSEIKNITSVNKINSSGYFTNYRLSEHQGKFLVITSKRLYSAALEYAALKESAGYNVTVIAVEELYHQFSYGIMLHPYAIRGFCNYALYNWGQSPEFLFIIGKGVHAVNYRKSNANYAKCHVPSYGNPSSDNLFTVGLRGKNNVPSIPTGRLAANNEYEVLLYRDKIRDYGDAVEAEWMKTVLHFGGGVDEEEQNRFKNYLSEYQAMLEQKEYGGTVYTLLKNSSDAVAISKLDLIKQKINEGTSMMVFFGHASSTGFDQDIDNPEVYENSGKYPFLIANSCYSGDIHTPSTGGISERWVIIENRGVAAFLASIDRGYASYLHRISSGIISNVSSNMYGASIGECFLSAIDTLLTQYSYDDYNSNACYAFTIHGDPSLQVYPHQKPDYKINPDDISFSPRIVTAEIDSFKVQVKLTNSGLNSFDTVAVKFILVRPSGDSVVKVVHVEASRYENTTSVYFRNAGLSSMGSNKLIVIIDPEDELAEYDEGNNTFNLNFTIYANAVVPVSPLKYSIVPNERISLIANYVGTNNQQYTCEFSIDTVADFSSSFMKTYEQDYMGGTVQLELPFALNNNTVYFWRVRNKGDNSWLSSSFIYKNGISGWSQSRSEQLYDNTFENIEYNSSGNRFVDTYKKLFCSNKGNASSDGDYRLVKHSIDGGIQAWGSCWAYPALNVAVIDSIELLSWRSNRVNFGQRNYPTCDGNLSRSMVFTSNNTTGLQRFSEMIDSVEEGHYILVQSFMSAYFEQWSEELLQKMENIGASQVRYIPSNYPYIFFVKKGYPETAREIVGSSPTDYIEMYADLIGKINKGSVTSTIIGPAKHWEKLIFNVDSATGAASYTNVYGIDHYGNKSFILKTNNDTTSLSDTLFANEFPFVELQFVTENNLLKIPSSLTLWETYFTPEAEISLIVDESLETPQKIVEEGEDVRMIISAQNISNELIDSMVVRKSLMNENNIALAYIEDTLYGIQPYEILTDTVLFNTVGYSGSYYLHIEFNAVSESGKRFFPEKNYFNNTFQSEFFVQRDQLTPIVDVTFDGLYIKNGDYVSPTPVIEILVADENKYFSMQDSSLVNVYIGNSKTLKENRIPYSDKMFDTQLSVLQTKSDNVLNLQLDPILEPGDYYLKIKASDARNNSNDIDFIQEFMVDTVSSLTQFNLGFNAITKETEITFTLTGSDLPEYLKIQIVSVDGRLVNELDFTHTLHYGVNKIQVNWDGYDYSGKKQLNGIYYYSVKTDKPEILEEKIPSYGVFYLFR